MPNYTIQILVEAKDKNVKQVLQGVGRELSGVGDAAERSGSRMQQAFTGGAIALTFGRAIPFIRQAVDSYNELRAGMVGLQSIVRYTNEDWGVAESALKAYTSDGLIPMSQATTALKNLLLRGFGLQEAIQLLYRLKDAAAYGRQGSLSLGQAVASASEGLKNMNPILVDNAGVTKNMSVMYKEFAASIGTTAAKLTDAQKKQAEYIGIMQETEPMVGNASQLQDELAGQLARAEAQMREMREAIGEGLAPAFGVLLDKMGPVTEAVKEFAEGNPLAIATLLGGSGLISAVGALAGAFALMGPGGALVVGYAAAILGLATVVATVAGQLHKSNQELIDAARAAEQNANEVQALTDEYVDLSGKPERSAEEHEQLLEVMEALAEKVPEATAALDEEGRVIDLNVSHLENYIEAQEILRQHYIAQLSERLAEKYREVGKASRELALAIGVYQGYTDKATTSESEFASALADVTANIDDQTSTERYAAMTKLELRAAIAELAEGLRETDTEAKLLDETIKRLRGELDETEDDADDAGKSLKKLAEDPRPSFVRLWETLTGKEWPETLQEHLEAMKELWEEYHEWLEERDAEQAERKKEELAKFRASLAGQLQDLGRQWADWEGEVVSRIRIVGDTFAQTVGAIVSGNQAAVEQLGQFWEQFFQWLIQMLTQILLQWAIGQALMAIGIPMAAAGGKLTASTGTGGPGYTPHSVHAMPMQHGGLVRGNLPGLDRVLIAAQHGELISSTALTRKLERMATDYTSGAVHAGGVQLTPELLEALREGGGEMHWHVHTPDAHQFVTMLRAGDLGRELRRTMAHGRLPRYG